MALTTSYHSLGVTQEFTANGVTPGNQVQPDVLALSNGGFVVAYRSTSPEGGSTTVLDFYDGTLQHQHVETVLVPTGAEATNSDGQPSVIELENGNVLVMWDDHVAGDSGLKGQLFTADGTPIGNEIDVFGSGNDGGDLQIAALEDGGFVLTFTDDGDVFQAQYNDAGVLQGTVEQVNDNSTGTQTDSAVAALSGGGYVVTYTDFSTADPTIRARVYDEDGNTIAADFALDTVGDNTVSKVVGLPDGNWAVVYTDTGWGDADTGNSGITMQIYSPTGENLTPGDFVHVNVPSVAAESQPDVTVLDNGFILVSWTRPDGAGGTDVWGRAFTQEGVPVTDEFPITTGGSDTDSLSNIAGLDSGDFVTAWQDSIAGDPVGGEGSDATGSAITATIATLIRITEGDGADDTFVGDELRDFFNGSGGDDTADGGDGRDSLSGDSGNDTLTGGGGNDSLLGGDDDDTLFGGVGDDFLSGGAGEDTMTGGSGDDTYNVDSVSDAVVETAGGGTKDRIQASIDYTLAPGAQIEELVTDALSTNPIDLTGNEADNLISGNGGDNILNGAGGADTLQGLSGDDTLVGGSGIDTASYASAHGVTVALSVAGAQDTGGDGTDTLSSIENLIGSNYADTLSGTAGDNTISGGGDNDDVKGYAGNDTLNGDAGDDALNGGANNDTLNGGDDNDTLIGQDGNDTLAGGSGIDTASYAGAVAGVTVALGTAGAQNTGGDGTDTLSSIENLVGSSFADTLSGTSGTNTISGGGNNDDLKGYSGDDTLNGDNGTDTLNGGANNDTLNGGENNDTLIGQDGNDALAGGNGIDTASYVGAIAGVTVALATTTAQNTVGDGTDTLSSIENLIGSNFADTLSGTSGINTISGGGNNDDLKGYSGDDTLNGDNGDDTLNGGANNDTLNGGENNDTLIGQDGNDELNGGSGTDTASYVGAVAGVTVALSVARAQNTVGDGTDTLSSIENLIGSNFADTLSGTSGTNTISGGGNNDDLKGYSGDDTLNGDSGDDTLNGGANNDTLNGGENNDTLIGQDGNDTLNGGNGVDTASYVGATGAVTVALSVATAQNTGGDGTDILSSMENLIGSGFADTLSGTSSINTISGGGNNDDLKGYSGDDTLNGDNGNDTLNGGANNDTLNGGANDDDLIGQDGADTLIGGTGADDFVFDDGHGTDVVTDFQNGADQFDLSAVTGIDDIGDLTIIDNGATVTVSYGTGSFTVTNIADPGQLDASDFLF